MVVEQNTLLDSTLDHVEEMICSRSTYKNNFYKIMKAVSFEDALEKELFTARSFARMYQTTYVTQLSNELIIPVVKKLLQKHTGPNHKTVCIPFGPGYAEYLIQRHRSIFTHQNTWDFATLYTDAINFDNISRVLVFSHDSIMQPNNKISSIVFKDYENIVRNYFALLAKMLKEKQSNASHVEFVVFN